MIKAIGTDLVDVKRIVKIGCDRFAAKILSQKEMSAYQKITHEKRKATFLAGRFAAKEALFKCFKEGDLTANYQDFEILNDENGAPYVISKFLADLKCHISISHIDAYAVAFVILEAQLM